jgi:RNA polymerase sigma-70 factor (ECF subfamily)
MSTSEIVFVEACTTLHDLVASAKSGDREARGQIYDRFKKKVLFIAYERLRHHQEAEDLCQDIFIHAFRQLHQLENAEAFSGWLCKIAHRMSINRVIRRRQPVSVDHVILEATVARNGEPIDAILSEERSTQTHSGLEQLRELDRMTLEAFYLNGQSLKDMSVSFNAPVGTIKRRLHVARKRLARECKRLMRV